MDIQLEVPAMSLHCLLLGCTWHCVFNNHFCRLVSAAHCIEMYFKCCLHNKIPFKNVTTFSSYLNTFLKDRFSLKTVLTGLTFLLNLYYAGMSITVY